MKEFFKQAFSDSGTPSSSRIISAMCAIASIGWITHVVLHTHALPDATASAGITAFSTSHYVANKVASAWGNNKDKSDNGDNHGA